MTQRVSPHSRHAIERAKFFLAKAKECPADNRVDFEAYLEASIVFGRSAIQRVQAIYKKEPVFKKWWKSLENDKSVVFFKEERGRILHEAPSKIGQKLFLPFIKSTTIVGGQQVKDDEPDVIDIETITSEKPVFASALYYIDDPSIPATQTVENHLNKMEAHINAFLTGLDKPRNDALFIYLPS